ncbi:two-component regulator propeller domain-containing protein [Gaetbulibacter aquiaggeris]|uniref:Two-component regulator propeller domain-containing protein n=1 Tax=Gaetbulibacter aquiaggeris TaxID=1735373 RepID=A0ABW7MPP7_9FLAO
MDKRIKLIYLILILTLNFSCVEKKSTEKETNKSELVATSKTDTLKFTSGIRAIFQDTKGNYWIGSHNEGLSFYNGKSFEYFTTNEGLADNQIRSIQEDENGIIWFGTANGVSSYDRKSINNHPVYGNSETEWAKTDNDQWFNAGTKQGVYRYDGQKLNYLAFPNPKVISSGNLYAVTGISKGKNKMLWFGTYAGVFGYNGNQFTTINDETLRLTEESEKLHVRSILEDSRGRLWIGNNGIGVILKSGDSIINFSKEQGKLIPMNEFEANTLSNQFAKNTGLQSVFAIAEDSEGNIWFGDRDSGAWKYDGKTLSNYNIDTKLNSQMIWSIYEDQDKNLLLGMAEGGIYKFNGKTFDKWH